MTMNAGGSGGLQSEINVTPLVDVVLVLLIICMVIVPLTLHGYEVREYLLHKWGRKCAYCGTQNSPLEIEHILPKSRGGSDRVSNLTLSCRKCELPHAKALRLPASTTRLAPPKAA